MSISFGSANTSKPPYFDGKISYSYWKNRMRTWLQSQGMVIWEIVKEGYDHPIDPSTRASKKSKAMDRVERADCECNQKL